MPKILGVAYYSPIDLLALAPAWVEVVGHATGLNKKSNNLLQLKFVPVEEHTQASDSVPTVLFGPRQQLLDLGAQVIDADANGGMVELTHSTVDTVLAKFRKAVKIQEKEGKIMAKKTVAKKATKKTAKKVAKKTTAKRTLVK